jgi:hypothetical protein
MICGECNKPISEGEYRAYQKSCPDEGWKYVTHHRKCSANDIAWEAKDKAKQSRIDYNNKFYLAAIAFRDQWNVSELDELIDDLREVLKSNGDKDVWR